MNEKNIICDLHSHCPDCGEKFYSSRQTEEHVCPKKIKELNEELLKNLVDSFRGVPLQIDEWLQGNSWYVAVSKELYEEIKRG